MRGLVQRLHVGDVDHAAVVADEAFGDLDAPVQRLAAPSVPVPFNTGLMDGMIPRVGEIRERMEWLLAY